MEKKFNGHATKGGVYKITNRVNGKIYIGSAKRFSERATGHLSSLKNNKHQNKHLQSSWNKHGADAFLFEVIEVVQGNKGERFKVEQKHIDKLIKDNLWESIFNFKKKTVQKERTCFSNTPEETRKKLSRASKKFWNNPKNKEKMRALAKEAWQNPKTRKKRIDGMRKEESRKKLSNSLKGNKNATGHKLSAKVKEKVLQNLVKGQSMSIKHSEETKNILREKAIKQWENPRARKKQSEISKKLWENPQYKDKMIRAAKKRALDPSEQKRLMCISAKKYILTTPAGETFEIFNLKKFCKEKLLNYGAMNKVASGKKKHHKNWLVRKHT